MKKDERIQVRVSKKDKKLIERNAEKIGVSISDFIIERCTEKTKVTKKHEQKEKILAHVVDVQTSLNELRTLQNNIVKKDEVEKVINQLEKEVDCLWQFLKL